jgi:hypothetical protein
MRKSSERIAAIALAIAVVAAIGVTALAASGVAVEVPSGAQDFPLGTQGANSLTVFVYLNITGNSTNHPAYSTSELTYACYGSTYQPAEDGYTIVTGMMLWSVSGHSGAYDFEAYSYRTFDVFITYSSGVGSFI